MNQSEIKKYIPLDKSWIIRMGILDMVNGYSDIEKFLQKQKHLGDDLLALKNVARDWNTDKSIDVGESGTLYRFFKFVSWKLDLNKEFIMRGTLKNRKITGDKHIINLSLNKLLALDNRTSQWASAAVLLGNKEKIKNPPYKLKLTYEAIKHWKKQRRARKTWLPRYDETIRAQAETYLKLLNRRVTNFVPRQAEDFCFAYVFGFITARAGERLWPSLRGHESDRIEEIVREFKNAQTDKIVQSKDHRVVQAIAMWAKINCLSVRFKYSSVVSKSWPQFWDFLRDF